MFWAILVQYTFRQYRGHALYKLFSLGDKRAVSQKGGFGERALVPVFVPGEHADVPSFLFSFRGNI